MHTEHNQYLAAPLLSGADTPDYWQEQATKSPATASTDWSGTWVVRWHERSAIESSGYN